MLARPILYAVGLALAPLLWLVERGRHRGGFFCGECGRGWLACRCP